jgi:heterodisulfide reductase subunit C
MALRTLKPKKIDPSFINEVKAAGGKNIGACFQCGTCVSSCPAGLVTTYKIRKILRKTSLGLKDDVLKSEDIWKCTTCLACYDRCPRGVEPVEVILAIRNIAVRHGYFPEKLKSNLRNIINAGQLVTLTDDISGFRVELGLSENSPHMKSSKALDEVNKILEITGIEGLEV